MPKRGWSELGSGERGAILAAGAVQVSLLVAALVDIHRRPEEGIRGKKPLWVVVSFVNIVGPLSYFIFGRKR
ncbi:MAG: PLDc_N domain-containing protein [Rubrobacter sp.]|nr:PLDc_N domain-containing protein [Rubrobacter sp.]